MFKDKSHQKKHHDPEAVHQHDPENIDIEAMVAEIEAAETGGAPGVTNHKYVRQDSGGWKCGHCDKLITDPRLIGEKTCPQA
jgi:hypothetical protein